MKKKALIQSGIVIVIVIFIIFANDKSKPVLNLVFNEMNEDYKPVMIIDTIKKLSTSIKNSNKIENVIAELSTKEQEQSWIEKDAHKEYLDIYSIDSGIVKKVGFSKINGKYIIIEHTNSISGYKNLDKIEVLPGQRTRVGQIIGSVTSNNYKCSLENIEKSL